MLVAASVAAGLMVGLLAVTGLAGVRAGPGTRPSGSARTTSARATSARATSLVQAAGRKTGLAEGVPFCRELQKGVKASAGALLFCNGPQPNGPSAPARSAMGPRAPGSASAPANVDAASPAEDVAPNGVRAYGQSEVSIAASGRYVAEAWNDSTAFFAPCPSPANKEEGTGYGFSANGGKSFTDLGGLPNADCGHHLYEGDPGVAAYTVGGRTYFYISSLYAPLSGLGSFDVAMAACEVTGAGAGATLSCGQPIVLASSSACIILRNGRQKFQECDFVDKPFIAIDPARHRLYTAYTDFPVITNFVVTNIFRSSIDFSTCDLGNAAGGTGPAGGTPARPVCENNGVGHRAYGTVAAASSSACENEGAYPAVDLRTGVVYIGYEFNLGSNTFGFAPCNTDPTADVLTKVPFRCLLLAKVAGCGVSNRLSVPVVSMDAELIPGYNRGSPADWPRLAVSDRAGTVSMVWNDARDHPLGDILLQSFGLRALVPVQATPVELDAPIAGAVNFLPAVRTANASGNLDVSWFSRDSASTSDTNVFAAINVSPRTTVAPASLTLITTVAADWDNDISDIVPNFGDYTDNAVVTTGIAPYVGSTLYVAWSDGRSGLPQPFEAHLPAG